MRIQIIISTLRDSSAREEEASGHLPDPSSPAELSVASLLDLLGAGVAGPILAALARRPLRTRALTDRLSSRAPRTVYRYAGKLAERGLIMREEEGGVPSVVTYCLSEQGRELFRLLDAHASHALARAVPGAEEGWWATLALLGEMWSSGWMAALGAGSRALSELSEMTPGMSSHQVGRRVNLLRARNLLCECNHAGRGKRYKLTDAARQKMGLIAAIGCWRERHGIAEPQHGLTAPEAATVLRVALPLARLDAHPDTRIKLGVVGAPSAQGGRGSEVLLVRVGRDGSPRCEVDVDRPADAWAVGTVDLWLSALVDGNAGRIRTGGGVPVFEAWLSRLRAAIWGGDELRTSA